MRYPAPPTAYSMIWAEKDAYSVVIYHDHERRGGMAGGQGAGWRLEARDG
jgi:hypothetical protein